VKLGVGQIADEAAESAHETGPMAKLTSSAASSPKPRSPPTDSRPDLSPIETRVRFRVERVPPRLRDPFLPSASLHN